MEYVNWQDTGCQFGGPSCLNCQLPVCVHDMAGGVVRQRRMDKRARIINLANRGWEHSEIASTLGISIRTVQRALSSPQD
jgi:hypothetical protein